ncbi:hypothetical protein XELAEV_18044099mg [Xenopus laevis]|uniref:Uncharacterized protein n=1 Tax=Xenopus laevis TaxID=8355 RepID=A0A974H3H8_XENLA|nr:hypothetical protein XELAEV_18044099mg [Xenopus laevis]
MVGVCRSLPCHNESPEGVLFTHNVMQDFLHSNQWSRPSHNESPEGVLFTHNVMSLSCHNGSPEGVVVLHNDVSNPCRGRPRLVLALLWQYFLHSNKGYPDRSQQQEGYPDRSQQQEWGYVKRP